MPRNVKRVIRSNVDDVKASFQSVNEEGVSQQVIAERIIDIEQELYCHACGKYVQFTVPSDVHANLVLKCPNCGHEHYRRVDGGEITESRWGQDPSQQNSQPVWTATANGYSATSAYQSQTARNRMYSGSTNSSSYGYSYTWTATT